MATVVQTSDLNLNEIQWLTNHLDHSVDIHQEYYRLHNNAIGLAKVSRVLLAVDSGKCEKFKGKRLNEIQVDVCCWGLTVIFITKSGKTFTTQ